MKISDLDQPRVGDIVEFETDPETVVEGVIVGETEDGYIYEFSDTGYTELHEACTYGKYYCSTDKKYKCRTGPKQSRTTEAANAAQQAAIAIAKKKKQDVEEEKQRLDPKCWDGYKKQGTKIKGGVRVNNCVPESIEQELNEFAPDGFNGGGDGEEFNPNLAKMAYDEGVVKGASLADGATTQRAMAINDWDKHDGGIYSQHFAKGFIAGRKDKIRHNNKQYNLNLKLMKDGSIRHGEQGVAEGSGNWYIRVKGKVVKDKQFNAIPFPSKETATQKALEIHNKKRIPLDMIKLTQSWMDGPEQGLAEDYDKYNDEEESNLRSGSYVRDREDSSGEVFIMRGDPYERRVQITDRNGSGWNISPSRLIAVDDNDPAISRYFSQGVAEGTDNITAVFSGYANYMKGRGANVFKHYGITVLGQQYDEDEDIVEYTVSGSKEALDQARAYLERSDQFGGMIIKQGVAEGSDDTVYPNATVIKTKNGKPVGEIYQDEYGWGCFHYRADRGYDMIDSREDAIQELKDIHAETGRSRPDYTIKGVAEAEYQGREVPLGRPMRGDVKKFKVYVKDPNTGNVKKVNFGDPNMRIKKSNPARRKSFRARHNCKSPGPRTKARYWSCRKW